jgi:hypothetical protein
MSLAALLLQLQPKVIMVTKVNLKVTSTRHQVLHLESLCLLDRALEGLMDTQAALNLIATNTTLVVSSHTVISMNQAVSNLMVTVITPVPLNLTTINTIQAVLRLPDINTTQRVSKVKATSTTQAALQALVTNITQQVLKLVDISIIQLALAHPAMLILHTLTDVGILRLPKALQW